MVNPYPLSSFFPLACLADQWLVSSSHSPYPPPPGWLCEAVASQRALRRESEETALATPSFAPRNFVLAPQS